MCTYVHINHNFTNQFKTHTKPSKSQSENYIQLLNYFANVSYMTKKKKIIIINKIMNWKMENLRLGNGGYGSPK